MENDVYEILYSCNLGNAPMMRFCRQTWFEGSGDVPHSYEYLKIFRVISGVAVWEVNGRRYKISSGDILMINNTEPRVLRAVCSEEPLIMEYGVYLPVAVQCSYECLAVYFEHPTAFQNLLPHENPLYKSVHMLFDMLNMHALHQMPLKEEMIQSTLKMLFVAAAEAFLISFPLSGADTLTARAGATEDYKVMLDTIQFILKNPAGDLSESALAGRVYMSKNRFVKLFHRYNGMTPAEYVRTFRVRTAVEMIVSGQAGVYEAAMDCGFCSLSGFYKAVTSVTGTTPGKWKNKLI